MQQVIDCIVMIMKNRKWFKKSFVQIQSNKEMIKTNYWRFHFNHFDIFLFNLFDLFATKMSLKLTFSNQLFSRQNININKNYYSLNINILFNYFIITG